MPRQSKPIVWLSGEVKTPPFSAAARLEAGGLLRRLQEGENLGLPHSRPMTAISSGCHELRIVDERVSWRIFYYVAADAIVVLEVDRKTTRQTPQATIARCQSRLRRYREAAEGD